MSTSLVSIATAKAAEQLISDIQNRQSSSSSTTVSESQPVSQTSVSSSAGDTIAMSPKALSMLSSQASMVAMVPSMALVFDAQDAMTDGQTTTFTDSYENGGHGQTVVTGALAGIVDQINQTGIATIQPGESAAEQTFANAYAAQLAAGTSGRFYAGDDDASIPQEEALMSPAEKASFVSAYNSRTLSVQSAEDSPAAMEAGSWAGTMLSGQSEWNQGSGYYANISSGSLPDENQYSFTTYSPFFGFSVISWGGPSSSQSTTSSTVSTVA